MSLEVVSTDRIKRLEDRLRILTEALRDFAEATTDYDRLLDIVAQRLAEVVKDGCVVRLLSEDGWLRPVAIHMPIELRVRDAETIERLRAQGRAVLAIDGLQPDVGQEVLWVIRECVSGEVLLARPLLSGTESDVAAVFREVLQLLPVPVVGVISDGQQSLRKAVASALPGVPHQLCQFHYLREAGHFIFEADRHAKKQLKKQVRGVRPVERQQEGRTDAVAVATRAYCLAVRSALTDDGRAPLDAAGLRLVDRLAAIQASLDRVAEKGGSRVTAI